jgi:hypothetical protein
VLIIAEIDHHGEPWLNRSFGKIIGSNFSFSGYPPSSNAYVRTLSRLIFDGYQILSIDNVGDKRVLIHLVLNKKHIERDLKHIEEDEEDSNSVCGGYAVEP